ncbi:MAG: 6-phosphofructokinase [Cyclobacteriaceae bacterium]|nr:6-phosphofructokinase [Cyclobacteriaceae bacterium]
MKKMEAMHLMCRQAILGHIQQGGNPSPFDRAIAIRMSTVAVDLLISNKQKEKNDVCSIGIHGGQLDTKNIEDLDRMLDMNYSRPREQWWLKLEEIVNLFGRSSAMQPSEKK